jgi:hypothetical protein
LLLFLSLVHTLCPSLNVIMVPRQVLLGRLFAHTTRNLEKQCFCYLHKRYHGTGSSSTESTDPIHPSTKSPDRSSPLTESTSLPPKAAMFPEDELWDPSWKMGAGEETIRRRMAQSDSIQLQFYSSWSCHLSQRAWIVLEEANVDYQWNEVRIFQFLERCASLLMAKRILPILCSLSRSTPLKQIQACLEDIQKLHFVCRINKPCIQIFGRFHHEDGYQPCPTLLRMV